MKMYFTLCYTNKVGCLMSKILSFIKKYSEITPNKDAITYRTCSEYKSITYYEFYEYINSFSAYLKDYKNKTIAIIGNNKLEYLIALFSIIGNIGNAFLIDKELYEEDIDKLFKQVKPDLIIFDDELNFKFKNYKFLRFSDVNKFMQDKKSFSFDNRFAGNLILHTSGTTGEPKCIMLDEKKYFGVIPELNAKWKVMADQSCLLIIPLYHIYALTSLFHGIYAGITNILEWDYKKLDDVLRVTKPCLFMGVPLMYNRIMNAILKDNSKRVKFGLTISKILLFFKIDARKIIFKKIHEYFGGNYIFGCSAGSLLSPVTNKFFNDVGLPIYNVYGMTETSGPIAINYKNNNIYNSVGKILNINKIKIINADVNGVGEIYVKGNNVFDGYLKDRSKNYFLEGFFDTGDIGYIKDNALYVVGRKKNILIGENGKNVSPEELNKKILENKQIDDCNVIMENNKLIAIINTTLTEEKLASYIEKINKKLPNYKKITKFKITNKKIK